MRLLVDMDDCIAQWTSRFDELVVELGFQELGVKTTAEQIETEVVFDKFHGLTPEVSARVLEEIFNRDGFYRNLEPISGALDALAEMVAEGHDVTLLTAPWQGSYSCASDKYAWVDEHLGREWTYKTILTNDKGRVTGDVLYDDRPAVRGAEYAEWTQVYFSAPHNAGLPGLRISDWADWREPLKFLYDSGRRVG